MQQVLDIQIKNIERNIFSQQEYKDELLHIVNSNKYHIIFFSNDCDCEVNFKVCKIKRYDVLFLNASDVFICKTKSSRISRFSFNYDIFNKEHCETQRLVNGLLFDSLLNCNILRLSVKQFLKFKLQLNNIISFQNKGDYKSLKTTFKELIIQSIDKKHKQSFSEDKISKYHQTVYKYLSLINENFKMEHNVFVYAQILRVQPKILTKIFSDLKIENPKSYLNKRILLAAKKILAYSANKSTEISYEIGFNEPAYFARFFKKNIGLTPKQFRAQQKLTESIY